MAKIYFGTLSLTKIRLTLMDGCYACMSMLHDTKQYANKKNE